MTSIKGLLNYDLVNRFTNRVIRFTKPIETSSMLDIDLKNDNRKGTAMLRMKELAQMSGVSQSAVSLILNGKADKRIAKETQDRVLAMAKKYDYQPNMQARNLRAKQSNVIGVWMPLPVDNGYSELIALLQRELKRNGYRPLFSFFEIPPMVSKEEFEKGVIYSLNTVCAYRIDGLIALHYHENLCRKKVPKIFWNVEVEGFDFVECDYRKAAFDAVNYLHGLGHRRIGFAGQETNRYYLELQKLLPRKGELTFLQCNYTSPIGGKDIVSQFTALKCPPTALLVHTDMVASGIIQEAMKVGISVPNDLSIISFRGTLNADYCLPPLSNYSSFGRGIETMVKNLIERINNPGLPVRKIVIEQEFKERESCRKIQ